MDLSEKDFEFSATPDGLKKKSTYEVQKAMFNGQTKREMIGLKADDPVTQEQMRYIFRLGGEMGMKKDAIKETYDIDSLKDLTVLDAINLINRMEEDAGVSSNPSKEEPPKPPASSFDPTAFKSSIWTKAAGVHMIDGKVAKCGLCKHYVSEGCELGHIKGKFEGTKLAPIVKSCFEFIYGELQETPKPNTEVETDDEPF